MIQKLELRFMSEGGAMGELIRQHDWSASPIGVPTRWPVGLRTLLEVMLGAKQPMFLAWGAEGTLLYNDGYIDILGLKHPRALGRPLLDVWSEIREELAPIVAQTRCGVPVHMDDILLMMDRHGYPEETHFTFSYTPVRDDETDAVAGFFCACRETTAQVIAERRLRESEAEAHSVLEGMGEGFYLLDRTFHVQRINAEGLRIDRRDRDAIVGRHLLEIWPEIATMPIWPWDQRIMAERRADHLVYRHLSDAHDVWLEVRASPSRDGLAVFYRDVSGARRAEEALRASEAQFRALAQAMPNHAWTARPDGSLDWFNQQVFTYSGLDFDALAGDGWASIVHPDDIGRAAVVWRRTLATGDPYEVEFRIRRADGAYRWHLIRAQPI